MQRVHVQARSAYFKIESKKHGRMASAQSASL